VINVLASFGVFHGDLEELLHGGIVTVIMILGGIKHILGNAHEIQFNQIKNVKLINLLIFCL